jgi:hypothetical protein
MAEPIIPRVDRGRLYFQTHSVPTPVVLVAAQARRCADGGAA